MDPSERPDNRAEDGEFWYCYYTHFSMDVAQFLQIYSGICNKICCYVCSFRMSFSEFKRNYSRIEICTLTPDTITSDSVKHWAVNNHDGTWRKGSTAGGCRNNACKFNGTSTGLILSHKYLHRCAVLLYTVLFIICFIYKTCP